jgi:hypothetical protein
MTIKVVVAPNSTEVKESDPRTRWRKLRRLLLGLLACVLLFGAVAILGANVIAWLRPNQFSNPMSLSLAAALVAVAGVLLSMQWKFAEKTGRALQVLLGKVPLRLGQGARALGRKPVWSND